MLSTIAQIHRGGRYLIKDREKARIYQEIALHPLSSRKSIAERNAIRPMTVSSAVQELIDEELVKESGFSEREGRGRPEVLLEINENRFVALSMYVSARQLHTSVVNLREESIATHVEKIDSAATNDDFIAACERSFIAVTKQLPQESKVLGIGIALIGTVAATAGIWISVSRWRNISNLNFSLLAKRVGVPVTLNRVQDSELIHFIYKHPAYATKNVTLIHWGYGIGASYARKGEIVGSTLGRFCEIGHTRVDLQDNKLCQCGSQGCLETISALWALSDVPAEAFQSHLTDELRVGELLQDVAIEEHPALLEAVKYMSLAVLNLYQLFYPDTILMLGPFIENEQIFTALKEFFFSHIPEYAQEQVELRALKGGIRGSQPGNVYPFFKKQLKKSLVFAKK